MPRLGRMRGSSDSSLNRSAHTPVALTTFAARISNSSPLSRSRARTPHARPSRSIRPMRVHAIGADGAEALGLAEDRQDEPHVVGLAVIEQVPARRLARGERGQQLEHFLAGDRAVALGAPRLDCLGLRRRRRRLWLGLRRGRALGALCAPSPGAADRRSAGPQALTVEGHRVIQVQPHPHQPIRTGAVEGRHDQRQRMHEVRRERDHQLALQQRLAHERQIEVLQVAQPAVHQLAGAAGGPGGVVGALDQRHAVTARGGVERHPGAGDAPADDHEIELVLGEGREGLGACDHASQSARAAGARLSSACLPSRASLVQRRARQAAPAFGRRALLSLFGP